MNGSSPPVNPTPAKKTLAITWAPNPKWMNYVDPVLQMSCCLPVLQLLYKNCDYIVMFPEFTLNGNIHFHGEIEVNDMKIWYKKVLPTMKRNGHVCLKPNPNRGWHDYIRKDEALAHEVLGEFMTEEEGLYLFKERKRPIRKDVQRKLDEWKRVQDGPTGWIFEKPVQYYDPLKIVMQISSKLRAERSDPQKKRAPASSRTLREGESPGEQ